MERLTKRLPDGKAVMDCDSCEQKKDKQCTLYECRASLIKRLAAYEDTGFSPEEIFKMYGELCLLESALKNYGSHERMKELAEADKEGRVVVLPCKGYSDVDIVRDGVSYRPDHWNIHLTAFAHGQNTPSGIKVGLFDIGEVERALQEMEGKKDG